MKKVLVSILIVFCLHAFAQDLHKTENIVLITFDGYRWQELFAGAEKKLINNKKFVRDTESLKEQYWAETAAQRREKLMPFFWNTIAGQGVLIGNRKLKSRVNVKNRYKFSYPGYSEIFCGYGDPRVNSNDYPDNPNKNILDFLKTQKGFDSNMAAFATWDAFPRIINSNRNGVPVFVNFKKEQDVVSCLTVSYSNWLTTCPPTNPLVSADTITYRFAKEYMHRNHPRFTFIGFDETDAYSHQGKYDAYLSAANMLDRFVEDLWNMIQTDTFYKDKTTIIITTDHGRGHKGLNMWKHHGKLVLDAHHIWLAAIGPDTKPVGEARNNKVYFQSQIAQSIAHLLGMNYTDEHPVAEPVDLITGSGK